MAISGMIQIGNLKKNPPLELSAYHWRAKSVKGLEKLLAGCRVAQKM